MTRISTIDCWNGLRGRGFGAVSPPSLAVGRKVSRKRHLRRTLNVVVGSGAPTTTRPKPPRQFAKDH